jgi:hypothetical protein
MYLRKADLEDATNDRRRFIAWALEGVKDYPRKATQALSGRVLLHADPVTATGRRPLM